ncbi:MBOAT family protein [Oxalobacteraceae bacterium]|nr:MBOAT family protein [Oxalobacteraceae bacterium]
MLFNSFGFLCFYLPLVLAGYFWLGRYHSRWPLAWLTLASLFFYGWWDGRFLPLLLASIVVNFWSARLIGATPEPRRKRYLWLAVSANLLLLAWFKYANFLADGLMSVAGRHWQGWDIVLPIGISFFTFTQIAFLVDCYKGQVREARFIHYALFVSYFPHLIAGPVLHHREMMPQFADRRNASVELSNLAIGLSIFVLGLAKKVLIADNLSTLVAPVFAADAHPRMVEAWIGALAYALQLYFDFSGYSDMAIGLSRLFGIKLPLNFDSPYKAGDIAEFWRRWHMTLSRFLRDYLYIPLGGKRKGEFRRCRNLMITMLLGGLWHGAGWTFLIWGGLHGLFLLVHRAWQRFGAAAAPRWWSWPLTLLSVMLAWVVFRAPDLRIAIDIWGGLVGANGLGLPHGLASLAGRFAQIGLYPVFDGIRWIDFSTVEVPVLLLALVLALFAPNTQEIFFHYEPAIESICHGPRWRSLHWQPSPTWSLVLAGVFICCLFGMNKVSEFLYFQF